MIARLKALKILDRRRLDAALMRIQGRPIAMMSFNLILLSINFLSHIKRNTKLVLNKLGVINLDPGASSDAFEVLPTSFTNRAIKQNLSVLIVCEATIPQCFRYRVEQKIEQLALLGLHCEWVKWTEYFDVRNLIHFHDVIIFYRIPGYPKAIANIDYAKRIGKIVVYDTDDLIFDKKQLKLYYDKSTGQLSKQELAGVLRGADLYRKALEHCQFAITTTTVLKQRIETILDKGNVFILPNGLDKHSEKVGENIKPVKQKEKLVLFYGSGSKTHDKDFAMIAGVLATVLEKYPHIELIVVGYLTIPDELISLKSRITKIELLEVDEYLHVLAHADINLAPLVPGLFANCKSEIKWLEAGILGIPTVSSSTRVYSQAISHGRDGLVAESAEKWHELLEMLINDENYRERLGQAAAKTARQKYSCQVISQIFSVLLDNMKKRHIDESSFNILADNIKHILVVNVLYPPQAMGGATVVTENIVNTLKRQYNDQFLVSVVTCDINNIYAHQVKEYEYDGVSVTAISVPIGPDVDYRGWDDYVGEIFKKLLEYKQPDLIHFHCIQRLTASMLQASVDQNIPYLVTVHDAWWLSDHQFLIDAEGQLVNELQANPAIAAHTSKQVQQTVSRSKMLRTLLGQARKVLAVSKFQADLYEKNGIPNVMVNDNGVKMPLLTKYQVGHNDTVVLGYAGSICHHKGYYFLKQVISGLSLNHIQLKVIQFDLKQPRNENWNNVGVEFLPKFESGNMGEFYSQIDILIAPSIWPESFGLVTREAALAGVWVIASQAGGLAEAVMSGKNGFKYEAGNAKMLIEIITQIDNNPARYKQRVADEYIEALNINTIDRQVSELVGVYNCVLESVDGFK